MAKVALILYVDPKVKADLEAKALKDGRSLSSFSSRLLEEAAAK